AGASCCFSGRWQLLVKNISQTKEYKVRVYFMLMLGFVEGCQFYFVPGPPCGALVEKL
ncbi:MAG: hypothetical protein JWQ14_2409, partial [Adhaeribacter sp.]|nr:hypothetical protein [Adhaeribacter sp.]